MVEEVKRIIAALLPLLLPGCFMRGTRYTGVVLQDARAGHSFDSSRNPSGLAVIGNALLRRELWAGPCSDMKPMVVITTDWDGSFSFRVGASGQQVWCIYAAGHYPYSFMHDGSTGCERFEEGAECYLNIRLEPILPLPNCADAPKRGTKGSRRGGR